MLSRVISTWIKIIKLGDLNELAYEDLILPINTNSSVGKVMLGLVRNFKSLEFLKGNAKLAWDRLINKFALHAASLRFEV